MEQNWTCLHFWLYNIYYTHFYFTHTASMTSESRESGGGNHGPTKQSTMLKGTLPKKNNNKKTLFHFLNPSLCLQPKVDSQTKHVVFVSKSDTVRKRYTCGMFKAIALFFFSLLSCAPEMCWWATHTLHKHDVLLINR